MENETINHTEDVLSLNPNSIKILEQGQNYLLSTSNWTKFFAVISFIAIAFMIFVGAMLLVASKFSGELLTSVPNSTYTATDGKLVFMIGIFYIIVGAILIIPFTYLNRFSASCRRAIMLENEAEMEDSLYFMKVFWKFIGVFTIVYIALMTLGLPLLMFLNFVK